MAEEGGEDPLPLDQLRLVLHLLLKLGGAVEEPLQLRGGRAARHLAQERRARLGREEGAQRVDGEDHALELAASVDELHRGDGARQAAPLGRQLVLAQSQRRPRARAAAWPSAAASYSPSDDSSVK